MAGLEQGLWLQLAQARAVSQQKLMSLGPCATPFTLQPEDEKAEKWWERKKDLQGVKGQLR